MATHDAIRYEWTYGDTLIKSLNPTITHTFHTPGEKEIELLTYLDVSCQTDGVRKTNDGNGSTYSYGVHTGLFTTGG